MKKTLALLLIIFLPAIFFGQNIPTAKNRSIAFRGLTLIDMRSAAPQPGMTVVIEGSRIAKIGKNIKIPKNTEVIDARGKYLIPGLWDMHVHIFNNVDAPGTSSEDNYFPMFIANGVTGVRDMFTDADDIKIVRRWQSETDAGKLLAPRIFPGSSLIDGVPAIYKNSVSVSNPDEARSAVRMFKEAGAGFIKVYENLSRESYYAIVEESKKLKIPFAGHVPNSITPVEASNAGQKSIEHLTRMLIACSAQEDKFKIIKNEEWTPALRMELLDSFSEVKCREVAAVFVRNQTWHDPTNVVNRASDDESFTKDARLRYVSASTAQRWIKFSERYKPSTRKNRERWYQQHLEIVKIMHAAGVPLLAGTDVGNPFVYAGFSLHDELGLFVQIGLSPLEALQTATINPAKYLGVEKSFGTIEKGKFADLLLLDANPLENIGNTRKIAAVVVNGRYLAKETLEKMLADVAAANKK